MMPTRHLQRQVQNARWRDHLSSGRRTLKSRVGDQQRVGDPTRDRKAIVWRGVAQASGDAVSVRRCGAPLMRRRYGISSCSVKSAREWWTVLQGRTRGMPQSRGERFGLQARRDVEQAGQSLHLSKRKIRRRGTECWHVVGVNLQNFDFRSSNKRPRAPSGSLIRMPI